MIPVFFFSTTFWHFLTQADILVMIFRCEIDDKRECTIAFREKNSSADFKDLLLAAPHVFNYKKSKEMASSKFPLLNFFMAIGHFTPKFYEETFFFTNRNLKNM